MSIIKLQGRDEQMRGIHYEFDSNDEPLGKGGMGRVYRGRCIDERTNSSRDVAIKFMYDDLPESVIERARREASIRIHNDNLVEMLGFIETESKGVMGDIKHCYHVVSELLIGVRLDYLLKGKTTDHDGTDDAFAEKLYKDYKNDSYHFALYIIKNVLSGVMALHDADYIHRDIDPTNIMVTSDGHVKLIDFGIAKKLSSLTSQDKSLTIAGQFVGKPEYAAPELVRGDVHLQNRTTDIYAIGIMFFQFIVGHSPFEGAYHEVLDMQLHKKMPLQLIKQKKVREVIAKATNKKQEQRYQSAAEFRVAVEQLSALKADSGTSLTESFGGVLNVVSGYAKQIGIAAAVVVACGAGYAGYSYFSSHRVLSDNENRSEVATTDRQTAVSNNDKFQEPTYDSAVKLLADASKASEGLKQLNDLESKGDFKATYLLGRLYYSGKDYQADEVKEMRRNCGIRTNLRKSHEMNIAAVKIDGSDYKVLFELGSDYVAGKSRTGIPNNESRDLHKAYKYLRMALEHAKAHNDDLYIKMINNQLKRITPYI